jgi:hypothetical protein
METFAEQIQKNWWKWVIVIVVLLWGLYLVWPKYEFDFVHDSSNLAFIRYNKVTGKATMMFTPQDKAMVIDFDKTKIIYKGDWDNKK